MTFFAGIYIYISLKEKKQSIQQTFGALFIIDSWNLYLGGGNSNMFGSFTRKRGGFKSGCCCCFLLLEFFFLFKYFLELSYPKILGKSMESNV